MDEDISAARLTTVTVKNLTEPGTRRLTCRNYFKIVQTHMRMASWIAQAEEELGVPAATDGRCSNLGTSLRSPFFALAIPRRSSLVRFLS